MSPKKALRKLFAPPPILVLPGAADALTARVIQDVGFEAVYMTGAGFANGSFALPDIGLISASDVVAHVRRIVDAVDIPVVVDADTGYGGPLNVYRTVRQLEDAGAAGIQIEDQAIPKRCGHFDGNTVVSEAEMLQRIAAALDARQDPDLVLIARTDGYQSEGLSGAVHRACSYADAGADVIFVEAPTTLAELEQLPKLIDAPLIANMVEGGKTPSFKAVELQDMGFACALFANTALRASIKAVNDAMRVLRSDGGSEALRDRIVSWDERQSLLRLPEMQAQEDRYIAVASELAGGAA
jgi:2-methylisocitrate lyase-like PEP mutase family enzyme